MTGNEIDVTHWHTDTHDFYYSLTKYWHVLRVYPSVVLILWTPSHCLHKRMLKNWTSQPAITLRITSRLNILISPLPHHKEPMLNSRMSSMAETCWKYTLKWLRNMPNASNAFARLCLMGLHSLQGQPAMPGSSAGPPGVAQKFCSFIGEFVFLTVHTLIAIYTTWKKCTTHM